MASHSRAASDLEQAPSGEHCTQPDRGALDSHRSPFSQGVTCTAHSCHLPEDAHPVIDCAGVCAWPRLSRLVYTAVRRAQASGTRGLGSGEPPRGLLWKQEVRVEVGAGVTEGRDRLYLKLGSCRALSYLEKSYRCPHLLDSGAPWMSSTWDSPQTLAVHP